MPSFQDTFETRKRSFISAFSICMTVHLRENLRKYHIISILIKTQQKNTCYLSSVISYGVTKKVRTEISLKWWVMPSLVSGAATCHLNFVRLLSISSSLQISFVSSMRSKLGLQALKISVFSLIVHFVVFLI